MGVIASTLAFIGFHSAVFARKATRRVGPFAARSVWEGVFQWIALIGAVAIALFILLPFVPIQADDPLTYRTAISNPQLLRRQESWAGLGVVLTLVSSACLFHIEALIRQRIVRHKTPAPSPSQSSDPAKTQPKPKPASRRLRKIDRSAPPVDPV
ncbi:MAG: hypothetical protein AAGF75_12735, partial [Cyanobacteria bacterium P01_H01_bin.130]